MLLYPDKSMRDEDVFNQRDRLCVTIENVMPPATYALPAAAKNGDVMGSMMGRVRLRPSPPAIALSTPVLPLTEPLQGPTILAPKRTALARIHSQVTRLSASVASVFSLKSKHKRHTTVQCSASSIFSFNINAIDPSSVPSLSLASPLSPAQPRSAGMNVHARPRWSASRPGRPKCAAASHLQQNPRRWRSAIRLGDHTQLDEFSSQMRSRGVVLIASRISVPSPATPCTLITPNGAPHGPISRICFVPLTGANAGACLRMVT